MENIAHISEQKHKPKTGMLMIWESDICNNLWASISAKPEAVIATKD